ncbi:MAG TPA: NAD(P)(+) transhydrogenase (Re/Si-specific) subunit beta [Bryobacteraceae bacterium]|jgi:NAD(P) transhydrogenase subunit beta|nr:NAD(P)(+) transhydrogenase (Re/Si-specific) subunit beta [Bryobacteraceae bacterium]
MAPHPGSYLYIVAAGLFILSLKWMNTPATARRGVFAGEAGMIIAVVATLVMNHIFNWEWILAAFFIGTAIGIPIAYIMPMTAVPQRTAMSHACGALAAALVGTAEFYRADRLHETLPKFVLIALVLETLLGFLTFTGSLMAMGKLQEVLPQRPITYRNQNAVNFTLFTIAAALGVRLIFVPTDAWIFPIFAGLALLFGVLLIIPIGGADMPTVIALLNSYAGLSACAMGFALGNNLLVVAGALDGSSGLILSIIMCKAMNRSFANVLFGAFGQVQVSHAQKEQRHYRSATAEEAASILESAGSVIIIPGYGLAVAQAQHKIRELYDSLMRRGVDVKFAIHPVAGRMPGHMNVLLAEADIPYDRLWEMEDINGEFPQCDVALVIGANDVTNPSARTDKSSPIYGMPILDVDKARTVMVIKRSMNPGFAGIDNDLYYMDKTLMLFGDAKAFVGELIKELPAKVGA